MPSSLFNLSQHIAKLESLKNTFENFSTKRKEEKKKKKKKLMISPGGSVKAAILSPRFFTLIFFNTVLNCFSCSATHDYIYLQSVFILNFFCSWKGTVPWGRLTQKPSPRSNQGIGKLGVTPHPAIDPSCAPSRDTLPPLCPNAQGAASPRWCGMPVPEARTQLQQKKPSKYLR